MKLIGISGALRKASTNAGMLRELQRIAPSHVTFEIASIHGIPLFDQDEEAAHGRPPGVAALRDRLLAADGILIATPEYNFSVPGVLKNALDWLSRGGSPFKSKRVGVIGSSEGEFAGTARAQYHLRQVLQALSAIVMPRPEVFVVHNEVKFDSNGNVTDERVKERLQLWFTAFLEWAEKKP
jgi:chromate reductase